jgi:hypothetical protein
VREVVAEIERAGGRAAVAMVNITDPAAVEMAVAMALERFGRLDILVNNAGVTRDNLLARMKREDWQFVIDVNLTGAFNCMQAVMRPMMKQRSGRIISISSVVGQMGNAGQANYGASKAGLIGLSKCGAQHHGERGRAGPDRHPHDPRAAGERAERVGGEGPARPARHCRGGGVGGLFPGLGGGRVHHGAGPRRQRRDVHVAGG